MKTVLVIMGHERYWITPWELDAIQSFVLRLDLSDYSIAAIMKMIIDKYGKNGEKKFQLNEKIMRYYFDKDKPNLKKIKHEDQGDPWNAVSIDYYIDRETKNKWVYEFWQGGGLHGINGPKYFYHMGDYVFKSNDQLDDIPLINCSECGAEILNKVGACPNCGHYLKYIYRNNIYRNSPMSWETKTMNANTEHGLMEKRKETKKPESKGNGFFLRLIRRSQNERCSICGRKMKEGHIYRCNKNTDKKCCETCYLKENPPRKEETISERLRRTRLELEQYHPSSVGKKHNAQKNTDIYLSYYFYMDERPSHEIEPPFNKCEFCQLPLHDNNHVALLEDDYGRYHVRFACKGCWEKGYKYYQERYHPKG